MRPRRIAGLVMIVIVAGGLWGWSIVRSGQQQTAILTHITSMCDATRKPPQVRSSDAALAPQARDSQSTVGPVLRQFMTEHVSDAEDLSITIHTGPAAETPQVRATHHAVIGEPDGATICLNVHCSEAADRIDVLGYVLRDETNGRGD